MAIIDHAKLSEIEMRQGIHGKFLSHKDLGANGCSLLVNTVDPGAAVPLHRHTVEETMLVLKGIVWVQIGTERHTVCANHTVIIPAHAPHAWGNAGEETPEYCGRLQVQIRLMTPSILKVRHLGTVPLSSTLGESTDTSNLQHLSYVA